jgi:uncharacterized membrane protein YecN with MAPEG domain
MPHLPITAITAAILGLIYLALSLRVIQARGTSKISLGDGSGTVTLGQEHTVPLLVAARSHANFAEYVPLCLILIGFVEMAGTRKWFVILLGVLLIAGRVLHPLGMGRKIPNPYRAGGIVMTFTVLLLASFAILVHALRVAAQ